MRYYFFILLATVSFFAVRSLTAAENGLPSRCLDEQPASQWELGLHLQSILPNKLPNFDNSLITYGPTLGIPLGTDAILLDASYGAAEALSLFSVEATYRLTVSTPFFRTFLLAGPHLFHYSFGGANYEKIAALAGVGFLFPFSNQLQLSIYVKSFFLSRTLVSFSGGFSYLL